MNSRTITRRSLIIAAGSAASLALSGKSMAADDGKAILIYFSRTGSVEAIANMVAKRTGCEALRLELVNPYADEYSDMTDIARNERRTGARREIKTAIPDLSGYDTVFIGTPYWWGGLSIPMRTFLTDHPMDGKRLIPFCVSASSSPSGLWSDIRRICTKAKIENGYHTTQGEVSGADGEVASWLGKLGF